MSKMRELNFQNSIQMAICDSNFVVFLARKLNYDLELESNIEIQNLNLLLKKMRKLTKES